MKVCYTNHGGHRGRDRMVVGFTTTYVNSAYHHYRCEFETRSWRGVLETTLCDKACQVGDFLRVLRFPTLIKLTFTNIWNIIESGVKHHNPKLSEIFGFTHAVYRKKALISHLLFACLLSMCTTVFICFFCVFFAKYILLSYSMFC